MRWAARPRWRGAVRCVPALLCTAALRLPQGSPAADAAGLAVSTDPGPGGRALHWVIRSSDLNATLVFLRNVFGMAVLRHEENAEPCPITCNGPFARPWSKTMVGFRGRPESEFFAIEVTYNYGISSYAASRGLRDIAVAVSDPPAALQAARDLGYRAGAHTIIGPDEYVWRPLPPPGAGAGDSAIDPRSEPFVAVSITVPSSAEAAAWYEGRLGMRSVPDRVALAGGVVTKGGFRAKDLRRQGARAVGYGGGGGVALRLVDDLKMRPWMRDAVWDGRFAVALPEEEVIHVADTAEQEGSVVHSLQVLEQDKLGPLLISIVHDKNGYEVCAVSRETFDALTAHTPYSEPDWDDRRRRLQEWEASAGAEL